MAAGWWKSFEEKRDRDVRVIVVMRSDPIYLHQSHAALVNAWSLGAD
jgi:hypothetical protein